MNFLPPPGGEAPSYRIATRTTGLGQPSKLPTRDTVTVFMFSFIMGFIEARL